MAKGAKSSSGMLQWLGLAFIILLVDQFTKVLIVGYYHLGDSSTITNFFNVVRVPAAGSAGFLPPWVAGRRPSFCGCCTPTPAKNCSALPWPAFSAVLLAT